ncbi:MAG: GNAT family N-acetyltransferase [Pseudomonadota bacterium]
MFRETFAPHNTAENMNQYANKAFGPVSMAARMSKPTAVTIVGEHQGDIVAYALMFEAPLPDCIDTTAPTRFLERFYVDSTWHGKGLADRLLAAVRDAVLGTEARHLWLTVWDQNPRAIRYYEKRGFTLCGHVDFTLGDDRQRDFVMAIPFKG